MKITFVQSTMATAFEKVNCNRARMAEKMIEQRYKLFMSAQSEYVKPMLITSRYLIILIIDRKEGVDFSDGMPCDADTWARKGA